jgi:PAS domain S-box-containing protein
MHMSNEYKRLLAEQKLVIEDLRGQNEKLLMQILKLMQSETSGRGESDIHGIFKFQENFNEFIRKLSFYINDDELYQVLADEIRRHTRSDRVLIVVQGGSVQRNLVVTHVSARSGVPQLPIPYFVSLEENDPYKDFLDETIDSGYLVHKRWDPWLETDPDLHIEESCAKAITIENSGTWIVCLEWLKSDIHHSDVFGFFENMVRYASVVMEQSLLLANVRELKEQQESIIGSMPSAIIGLDFLGNVTIWNGKAEEYFGIASEDAIGQPFAALIPALSFISDSIMETVSTEKEELVFDSVVHISPGGKQLYLQPHLYNMLNSNRGELALRIDDITQQINLQHQLLHAQKMETVGTLAGGMAHDFNNILSGIVGTLSLMKKRWNSEDRSVQDIEDLSTIDHCTKRASDLVSRLLDLSRKSDRIMKPMNLAESLQNVVKIIRGSFDADIKINYESQILSAWILGDKNEVENSILNLCLNARDAMKRGGDLKISLAPYLPDDQFSEKYDSRNVDCFYMVKVRDTGSGMNKETIEKIFQAFYTTKPPKEGTGLGLAILDKIIREHQGIIQVDSAPGQGSEFSLYFPAVIAGLGAGEDNYRQADKNKNLASVLIVDDDEVIRSLLVRIMKAMGYQYETAQSGLDAVRILAEERPFSLVILDIDMPGMNGLEVFSMYRQVNPLQKVIFCTGRSRQYNLDPLLAKGNCVLVDKPYTVEDIENAVKKLIKE